MDHTGQLVAERRVGRGRIIVTAFSLSDRKVVNWQNLDGFLNGCLLRRPARKFAIGSNGYTTVGWSSLPLSRVDARLASGLRYFSRDAAIPGEGINSFRKSLDLDESPRPSPAPRRPESAAAKRRREQNERQSQQALAGRGPDRDAAWGLADHLPAGDGNVPAGLAGFRSDSVSGVSGWNDFSVASNAARQSLKEAAGISVPNAKFVARLLGVYLLCLVPLNWLLFRLLRRVEWAWFAAPLIAIAGAVGVVRLAQLDIGFVRSRTEIAIVEMQPEFSRAHVTRYCGLYTSLTSSYALEFADSRAFALPFSTDPSFDQLRLQNRQEVSYVRDKTVGLSGYPVLSNSTGMVHAEQMVDLGGQVALRDDGDGKYVVVNASPLTLKGGVVIANRDSRAKWALLGDLQPGAEAVFEISDGAAEEGELFDAFEQYSATAERTPQGEVSLRDLFRLGMHSAQLWPGDMRLVAWTDEVVAGMQIKPKSNQQTYRTLIICHLRYGDAPLPEIDYNHYADFKTQSDTEQNPE